MAANALVLNASYEPIHVISWQKAIQLLFQGKVEVLEESEREVRSVRITIRVPSVLRLLKYIPIGRKHQVIRFSRANVFLRDSHHCQYCGRKFSRNQLTLDHVIPVVKGGKKNWNNIVTSCRKCNQRKSCHTPGECGMKLIRKPYEPIWLPKSHLTFGPTTIPILWKPYLKLEVDIQFKPADASEDD